jgi:hypothetical protein
VTRFQLALLAPFIALVPAGASFGADKPTADEIVAWLKKNTK